MKKIPLSILQHCRIDKNEQNFTYFIKELILNKIQSIWKIVRIHISLCFIENLFIISFTFEHGLVNAHTEHAEASELKTWVVMVMVVKREKNDCYFFSSLLMQTKENVINVNIFFFFNKFAALRRVVCTRSLRAAFNIIEREIVLKPNIPTKTKKYNLASCSFFFFCRQSVMLCAFIASSTWEWKISFHCLAFENLLPCMALR